MDLSTVANLGVAGIAIFIMWRKDQMHAQQLDSREAAFRKLENDVREKVMIQLNENTRIFEQVLKRLGKR